MPKFMIACQTKNGEKLPAEVMREAQSHFLRLIKERFLETVHISASGKKFWLVMNVPDQPFAENVLRNSPLATWVSTELDELDE